MSILAKRPVVEGLDITVMGLGGTGLGNMYSAVDTDAAVGAVHAAFASGIRYFDTAPVYGFGLAESRLGEALRTLPRDEIVISSKVGYDLVEIPRAEMQPTMWADTPPIRAEFRYTRDAVLRSIEGTMKRLGVDRLDMLAIHDPDEASILSDSANPHARSRFKDAMEDAYPVLDNLRSQGVIRAVGVGINQWQMLVDFVQAGRFDYFLLANRYTLLEQAPLDALFPLCEEHGTRIIVGGPFNSGILAMGAVEGAPFDYKPATPDILDRVRRIESVCARHGVPLAAAALQFPLGHPLVSSIIPGARSAGELERNVELMRMSIPPALWEELKSERLVAGGAPTAALDTRL